MYKHNIDNPAIKPEPPLEPICSTHSDFGTNFVIIKMYIQSKSSIDQPLWPTFLSTYYETDPLTCPFESPS